MTLTGWRCLYLVLAILFISVAALYFYLRARGQVICSMPGHDGRRPYTFCIRQFSTEPPGLNGSHLYRCEVWQGNILLQASSHRWDSFTALKASIHTDPESRVVVFHLDEHEITCSAFGIGP